LMCKCAVWRQKEKPRAGKMEHGSSGGRGGRGGTGGLGGVICMHVAGKS
jgi:hypothetical protein